MTKKATKKAKGFILIEKIMPQALQKQIGLDELSDSQLANLNAWLNLPRTKAVLGPGHTE
ncbi:MAG TPA: hypothetical protein VGG93_01310 [Candidatus Udaeobacter sp.]|jgi:hypothetical protein